MQDAIIFVGIILAVVLAVLWWKLGSPLKWKAYFSTPDGKGILKGIILAPAAILLIAAILALLPRVAGAEWLNDASVFAGLDWTKNRSPMCDPSEVDDRGTSNLGAVVNVWQSASENVRVNTKYTHHSCAIGSDDKTYDALGVEVEWTVWKRN